tara:strand:- start:115730 stop:117037 length:1308 start_codon:yes stop_codon:yes gene_type:complete
LKIKDVFKKLTFSREKKTFLTLGLEYFIKILLGTIVSVWVARFLGPEDYGNFTYIISFVLIFSPFYTMACEEVLIKYLVEEEYSHDLIMGSGFLFKLLGSLIGFILVNGFAFYFAPDNDLIKVGIFVYSIFMMLKAFQVIDNYYLAIKNIKVVSFFRNIIMVILSLCKIAGILNGKSWLWFVYISSFELFLYMLFYSITYFKDGKYLWSWKPNNILISKLFKISFPLVLISFCSLGVAKLDQVMIMNIKGSVELGKYAVSVKLIELWQFVPMALISSFFPKIVSSFSNSKQEYRKNVKELYFMIITFSLLLATGTTIVSEPLIKLLYGEMYLGAGRILALYSWTILFLYITLARNKIFIIENLVLLEVMVVALTLVINFALNIVMIPMYGAEGAILASVGSYFLANVLASIVSKRMRMANRDILVSLSQVKTFFK